jgi:predicted nucleotidyltransferase
LPLDIIPFGDIADNDGAIQWPPDYAVTMSVIGFDEAYNAALWVTDGDLQFKVASLAGIALLKLIAWDEKGQERNKDAADFYTILERYQTIHQDRLWDEYVPSEQYGYDISLCCSFLLGFDIKAMLSDSAKDVLLRIHTAKQDQFISVIARTNSGVDIAQLESQFRAFWHGLAF